MVLETSKVKVLAELIKAVWRGNSCSVGAQSAISALPAIGKNPAGNRSVL